MQYHIDEAKLKCYEELDKVCFQYSYLHKGAIVYFLKNDLFKHIIIAFIGLIPTVFIASLNKDVIYLCVSFYFLFLGAFALYEHMKERMFHMEEILELSYLNSGRRFLYKSICLSLVQMLMLGIYVFLFYQQDFLKVLLMSLLPAYFAQILALLFMEKIYSVYSCFIVYVLSYISVLMVVNYIIENVELAHFSPMIMLGGMWILMMMGVLFIYKKKGTKVIWN